MHRLQDKLEEKVVDRNARSEGRDDRVEVERPTNEVTCDLVSARVPRPLQEWGGKLVM